MPPYSQISRYGTEKLPGDCMLTMLYLEFSEIYFPPYSCKVEKIDLNFNSYLLDCSETFSTSQFSVGLVLT